MSTPMQRYRANMRRAGFRHISFWIHVNDIEVARATVGKLAVRRQLAELVEITKKGKSHV